MWSSARRLRLSICCLASISGQLGAQVAAPAAIAETRELRARLAIFSADSLLFEPGTRFQYSSYGWNLIGAVIEGASGEAYPSFMQREVFRPLGMTHTVAEDPDTRRTGREGNR